MKKKAVILYICIEALLYAAFLYMDFSDRFLDISAILKYVSIIICVAAAIYTGLGERFHHGNMRLEEDHRGNDTANSRDNSREKYASNAIITALVFTAFSDWFLLFGKDILPGVLSFCVVQTVYLAVITGADKKHIISGLLIRIISGISLGLLLSWIFVPLKEQLFLLTVVIIYGCSFVGNIGRLTAKMVCRNRDNSCLFALPGVFLLGLILFLMCDLNVLFFNLGEYINIESSFYECLVGIAPNLIWAFYLPSQILIVLSAKKLRW